MPIYDSLSIEAAKQLRDAEPSSTFKFFVDVQKKTKLETNLQSASLLPHYNTFEARAMRVVISDLPPEYSDEVDDIEIDGLEGPASTRKQQTLSTDLKRTMELLEEARASDDGEAILTVDNTKDPREEAEPDATTNVADFAVTVADIENALLGSKDEPARKEFPPKEQVRLNNGAGTIIGKLIYNTVTTLYVGEKIMIQMPTWFFPAGAGPYSEKAAITTHGEPSPTATFRFAEPIFIDKQQNFRVEIEVPDTDTLKEIQRIYGPLNVWVVLDGYMTRDVQ